MFNTYNYSWTENISLCLKIFKYLYISIFNATVFIHSKLYIKYTDSFFHWNLCIFRDSFYLLGIFIPFINFFSSIKKFFFN